MPVAVGVVVGGGRGGAEEELGDGSRGSRWRGGLGCAGGVGGGWKAERGWKTGWRG